MKLKLSAVRAADGVQKIVEQAEAQRLIGARGKQQIESPPLCDKGVGDTEVQRGVLALERENRR